MYARSLFAVMVALGTLVAALANAQDKPAAQPGFVPDTGQINTGSAPHPPSATPAAPIADHEQVRAALLMPDPGTISPGEEPNASGKAQPQTTGKGMTHVEQPGPIGSTLQTKPAKFSRRNDLIDHTPTMAMPLRLDSGQRQQIVRSVMSGSTPAFSGTPDFKPADAVPFSLTAEVRPMPESIRDIPDLSGLAYLKGKEKVYLVTTRTADPIVVDVLTGK